MKRSILFLLTVFDILTFALNLEHLENAFYHDRLAKYSKKDFLDAGYPAWVRDRFQQIAQHEKTHVELLSNAIAAAGGKVAKPCKYKL
jgi:rubrerythrin